MFAPKAPKPKVTPKTPKTPKTPMVSSKTPATPQTPLSITPATPETPKTLPKLVLPDKKEKSQISSPKSQNSTPKLAKKEKKRHPEDAFIVHEPPQRSVKKDYPELPIPQTEGIDKERQHKDDIAETKRRLEIARQKKMAEKLKEKELKKQQRNRKSSISNPKSSSTETDDDDIKRYDSKRPDSPPPKKDKSEEKKPVVETKEESESGSDVEWQRTSKQKAVSKNKRSKKFSANLSSDEEEELGIVEVKGEAPIISTRKSQRKTEAEAILNDQTDDMPPCHGFETVDIDQQLIEIYNKLLANDGEAMTVDDVTEDQLDQVPETIYIDNAHLHPGGAAKLAPILKKAAGGSPKTVRGVPKMVEEKLKDWNLKRKDVEIVTAAPKIRNKKRIYTQQEYDTKCGVTAKKAKVAMDEIEAQLQGMESEPEEEIDRAPEMEVDQVPEVTKNGETAGDSGVNDTFESEDGFTGFEEKVRYFLALLLFAYFGIQFYSKQDQMNLDLCPREKTTFCHKRP